MSLAVVREIVAVTFMFLRKMSIKQIVSGIWLCMCTVIIHRVCQNVVRRSVMLVATLVKHFFVVTTCWHLCLSELTCMTKWNLFVCWLTSVCHSCAVSNLKKCSLELGGKSPLIIFSDCDMERAIRQVRVNPTNWWWKRNLKCCSEKVDLCGHHV